MSLEFGVFDHLDRNDLPLRDYYEERLKIVEAFERGGFHAYHVAEHHFTPLGAAPSPSVFLAAIAQRTKRLRFGTFVYALPIHHPLRVLEEICMLDHMSGGRVEIGFGRGSVAYEIAYYGQNAEERQQIYTERLELILKAFESKRFTFKGQYDTFENVPLDMEPLQKPHPPLWYGAHGPESAERAARRGLNIVCNDMLQTVCASMTRFREVWPQANPGVALPKMGLVRFVFVGDSDEVALRVARRAYLRWKRSFTFLHEMHGTPVQSPLSAESFDKVIEQGHAIAGRPETVTRFLAEQLDVCGANYVVAQMAFGDLTLDEMRHSVDLFSREVMPRLRESRRAAAE